MELLPSLSEFAPFLLAMLGAGIVAGFLAGLFGIGGGAVLVPVFYQIMIDIGINPEIVMHVAIGTSLAIIIPTSIRSFNGHRKKTAVDMDLLKSWIIPLPIGVFAASFIASYISGADLKIIFALIALVVALRLLFGKDHWRLGDDLPKNPTKAIVGAAIGFFSTFMGIGGGVMNNTFMTLYGRPIHQALATSAGVGALISIPGALGYIIAGWGAEGLPPFSLGFVNIPAMLIVTVVTLIVAPAGVTLAHKLTRRQLQVSFGAFLVLVSMRFFYSYFWG